MAKMYIPIPFGIRSLFLILLLMNGLSASYGQGALPDVFKQETLSDQLNYLNEHTRIYDNYRAIREDMFQAMSRNTLDTINKAKHKIRDLNKNSMVLNNRIDSLNKSLESTHADLDQKIRTKNSIQVLGMEVKKNTYNAVMWSIVGILVFLLLTGYLTFRVNRSTTLRTKKDLEDLKQEFESYRTQSRLAREQMARDHFNEIKRLKAGGSGIR
jgi:hypothetical protein